MDVVAFLPRLPLLNLRVALGAGATHSLRAVSSWGELHDAVQQLPVDVIVADPAADGSVDIDTLESLRLQLPSVPLVIYTTLAPTSIRAIVRLARSGVEHVVFAGIDDKPGLLRALLDTLPAYSLGEQMLEGLAGPMAGLPTTVVRAVDQLFRTPARFKSTQDLADAAGMNLRTLYRSLEPAGIFSARMLVVSARLLRAYSYLQDPGRSIKDVADKTGYSSPWQLSQQMREITGQTAEHVRHEVTGHALVTLLTEQVQRRRRKR